MTTVAYDGLTLAADSRLSSDIIETVKFPKLYRSHDGYLLGFAGDPSAAFVFVEWFDSSRDAAEFPRHIGKDFEVLAVSPSGRVRLYDGTPVALPMSAPVAIGSGGTPALGAMLAGADAKTAVRIAAKLDPGTGGPVRTLSVQAKSARRKATVQRKKKKKR